MVEKMTYPVDAADGAEAKGVEMPKKAAAGSPGELGPEGAVGTAAMFSETKSPVDIMTLPSPDSCAPDLGVGGPSRPGAGPRANQAQRPDIGGGPRVEEEAGRREEGAGGREEEAGGREEVAGGGLQRPNKGVSAGKVRGGAGAESIEMSTISPNEAGANAPTPVSQGSLPPAQGIGGAWADSVDGSPPADSQAMGFIRALEGEGPVRPVASRDPPPASRKWIGAGNPPTAADVPVVKPKNAKLPQSLGQGGQSGTSSVGDHLVGGVPPPPPAAPQVRSYAGAVKGGSGGDQAVRPGGPPVNPQVSTGSGYSGSRRYVVRLKYTGEGRGPDRREVVKAVLATGTQWSELYALIHPGEGTDYGVSFMGPGPMERFINAYIGTAREGIWKNLKLETTPRPDDIRPIVIQVLNESIPEQDILTWLGRYGSVEGNVLNKIRDEWKIWTGAWRARIKLHRNGGVISHLPASTFLGRDRITVSCPGQPRACFRCGSLAHLSANCTSPKCVRCGGEGHLAGGCSSIRCNLCGALGHPYSRCPAAYREGGAPAVTTPGPGPGAPADPTPARPSGPQGAGGRKAKAKTKHLGPVQEEREGAAEKEEGWKQDGRLRQPKGTSGQAPRAGAGVVATGVEEATPTSPEPEGKITSEPGGGTPKRPRDDQANSPSEGSSEEEEEEGGGAVVEMVDPEWKVARRKRKSGRSRPKGETPQAQLEVAVPAVGRPLVTVQNQFVVLTPDPMPGVEGMDGVD